MPAFRIELAVPHRSEAVEGTGLLAALAPVVRRKATVKEVSGAALLRPGASCDLRVSPASKGKCLVRLSCAGQLVYGQGTTGFTDCTIEDHRITHVTDREPTPADNDPEIDVDTAAGTLVLGDQAGQAKWTATFGLD